MTLSYFSACSTDATEAIKAMYTNIREFINCCEPMEIALLPVVTNLNAVGLGPKNLMAIPGFLTKEEMKHRGPAYHAYAKNAFYKPTPDTLLFPLLSRSHGYRGVLIKLLHVVDF